MAGIQFTIGRNRLDKSFYYGIEPDGENGINCSEERQELIQSAKSFIGAYIEQAMLGGKISPPSGIFLMKNWLSYKDAISIEEAIPQIDNKKALTAAELPKLDLYQPLQIAQNTDTINSDEIT